MFRIGEKLRDPKVLGAVIEEWMKDKPESLIKFLRNRKVLKLIYANIITDFLGEDEFYTDFFEELDNAKREVIIYSPFVHSARLIKKKVLDKLRECVKRGVSVKVYVRPRGDPSIFDKDDYEYCLSALENSGIKVYELSGFHAKLVIIDHETIYVGGINVLSHKEGSPDCMLKIKDPDVAEVLIDKIRAKVH